MSKDSEETQPPVERGSRERGGERGGEEGREIGVEEEGERVCKSINLPQRVHWDINLRRGSTERGGHSSAVWS